MKADLESGQNQQGNGANGGWLTASKGKRSKPIKYVRFEIKPIQFRSQKHYCLFIHDETGRMRRKELK